MFSYIPVQLELELTAFSNKSKADFNLSVGCFGHFLINLSERYVNH